MEIQSELGIVVADTSKRWNELPAQIKPSMHESLSEIAKLLYGRKNQLSDWVLQDFDERSDWGDARPRKHRKKATKQLVQAGLDIPTFSPSSPSICLSGAPDLDVHAALIQALSPLQFHAFRQRTGVIYPDTTKSISVRFYTGFDDFKQARADWPSPTYGIPSFVTCAIQSPQLTWSHAYFFPRPKKVFVELLREDGNILELLLRQGRNVDTLGGFAQKLGYKVSSLHSGFLPRGMLASKNQPYTIAGIDDLLKLGKKSFEIDTRAMDIVTRVRQVRPAHTAYRFRRYGARKNHDRASFDFKPHLFSPLVAPAHATRTELLTIFERNTCNPQDVIVITNNRSYSEPRITDEYNPYPKEIVGIVSRYKLERSTVESIDNLLEPAVIVEKHIGSRKEMAEKFYGSGASAVLFLKDEPPYNKGPLGRLDRSMVDEYYQHHHNRVDEVISLQSITRGIVYKRYEKQVILGGCNLDTDAPLREAFTYRGDEDVLALMSKTTQEHNGKAYVSHIPMLDFATPSYTTVRDRLKQFGERGFIAGSGNSFHFYGDRPLSPAQFTDFYTRAFYELRDIVDVSHICKSLQEGFACLRLTANRGTKSMQPVYISEV